MDKSLLAICLVLVVCSACSAYKILVAFPYPGKSHTILGEGYARLLAKAGHEVTYITPALIKNAPSNLRQIDVTSNIGQFSLDNALNLTKLLSHEIDLTDLSFVYSALYDIANVSIKHENVQNLIMDPKEEFDVVVGEWLYSELYSGFATVFNCPFIYSSSMEPHIMVLRLMDGIPNPAYTPDHMSLNDPPFTFKQRVEELFNILYLYYIRWQLVDKEEQSFKEAFGPAVTKRGRKLPTFDEVKFNASLMLGNAHVSTGLGIPLPANHISISGYHINEDVAPLPEIMDNAPNGVIYFSMGTMMKSKTMPDVLKRGFLEAFSTLKQKVIWKYEENLSDLPHNVHIVQWAPQQSILAHPNCILFVTHGGLLSTTEALHFGVPIIGIPLFADQYINIQRAVNKGFALQVKLAYDAPTKLRAAIDEMLENPKYRDRVKALSFVYHHRTMKPGAALVHWVEHVVETHGAPHLRSPALMVPWYQKLYLDLLALILVTSIVLIKIVKYLLITVLGTRKLEVKVKRN